MENKGKYYRFDSTKKDTRSVNIDKSGVLNDLNGCHTLKLSGNDLEITTNDGTIDKTISVRIHTNGWFIEIDLILSM